MKRMKDSNEKLRIQLEESIEGLNVPEDNRLVTGEVVQISQDSVFIDIGLKSEGRVAIEEFAGEVPVVGDKVEVLLVNKFARNGPELSKRKADANKHYKQALEAFKERKPVHGKIIGACKGGYEVEIGNDLKAFLPQSQLGALKNDDAVGLESGFLIEKFFGENNRVNIVVNRKKYLESLADEKRKNFFQTANIGDVMHGVVTSLTSFGAFIDIGGFDGLLHVNDMSWGHVEDPKSVVSKGQEVDVKLIRIDPEEGRINLSLKHMSEDPWMSFDKKYQVGTVVDGVVRKIVPFGAFVEIEEGIEGLVHISEISWTKKHAKIEEVLKVGDKVKCMVLGYDIKAGRVSLGIKQATENPWDSIQEKYPVGSKVSGKVVDITNNGAFVALEDGIDAYLNVADMSWEKGTNKKIGEYLKVGDDVEGIVLVCDSAEQNVRIGVKQLGRSPWQDLKDKYPIGSSFEGEITAIKNFGVLVKTPTGVEGLIGKGNLSDDRSVSYEDAVKKYKVGDKITVYVAHVDVKSERAVLSVREVRNRADKEDLKWYASNSTSGEGGAYTLGDYLTNTKS